METPGQDGIHKRLITGSAAKSFALGLAVLEQIVIVPVFLTFWGAGAYGDWLVVIAAAGMLWILDFGLQSYYANAMQAAGAQGDQDAFTRYLHEGCFVYAVITAIALPVVLFLAYTLSWQDILNVATLAGNGGMRHAFALLAIYYLAMTPFGIINAIYRAHGNLAGWVLASLLVRVILVTGSIAALLAGAGPLELGFLYVAAAGVSWAIVVADLKRRYPDVTLGLARPDKAGLQKIYRIAPLYASVPIAMMVTIHGTVILISALAAAGSAVAVYATTRTLAGLGRMTIDQILNITGAELARQFAQGQHDAVSRLFQFVIRLTGGASGAIAGAIAVMGPPFLGIWTLGKITFEPMIFWPLLAAAALAGPSLAGASVLNYINRPKGMARGHAVAGAVTILLCALLIPAMGPMGAAWAVLVAEVGILSIIIPWHAANIIGEPPLQRILEIQGFAVIGFVLSYATARAILWFTGADSLMTLIGAGLLWCAVVVAPLGWLLFNRGQRKWIVERLRGGKGLY